MAFNDDLRALLEVLLCELSVFTECDAADEIGVLLSVFLSGTVDGQSVARHRHRFSGLRVTRFRVFCQATG